MASLQLPDDKALIPRLLAGEEAAYTLVVTAYHGLMVHLAKTIVGEAIADEVAQESWLSIMKALPRFEGRSSLKTWVLRIVSNTAKSRLRHESRTVSLDGLVDEQPIVDPSRFKTNGHWSNPPPTWHGDSPDALLAGGQLRECIDNALSALPPMQRAAITLRDMQGFDMETICKILEVSESNGRVLLHRARSSIQQAIDEHEKK